MEPIENSEIVLFRFERLEVEKGDVTNVLKTLKDLAISKEALLKNQGKIDFEFNGYWDDPREIDQIPEIVSWIKKLDDDCLPWFWLLSTNQEKWGFRILMKCLLRTKKLDRTTVEINKEDQIRFLENNFNRLNVLCDTHEIPLEINKKISLEILDHFEKVMISIKNKNEPSSKEDISAEYSKIDFKLKGDQAEEVVYELATKSFFIDWCYPNPKLNDGKELCDLLIVFDQIAIIWQIKDLKLDDHGNYRKRDVEKNLRQLLGARKKLLDQINHITLNNPRRGEEKLDPSTLKEVYLISAMLGEGEDIFSGFEKLKEQKIHVFNRKFIQTILNELDTISDFTEYLKQKESFLSKVKGIFINGDEDELLGVYLMSGRSFPDDYHNKPLIIEKGILENFNLEPIVKAEKEEDRISYLWDRLIDIQHTTQHPQYEIIAREFARLTRYDRRVLGKSFLEALVKAQVEPSDHVFRRYIQYKDVTICFVFFPFEIDREQRQSDLQAACFVARGKIKKNKRIIGIATEKHLIGPRSYDFLSVYHDEWTSEDEKNMNELIEEGEFFKNKMEKDL